MTEVFKDLHQNPNAYFDVNVIVILVWSPEK